MSYKALYRKYRPDAFGEVKGQEHVVTALSNQVRMDRIAHAYLFCGSRGTGKTSVAKIFARAVNCENPQNGSPCGECRSCRSIAEGSSLNVIEIDAASNNGVDNVRQIREETTYSPTEGKYKVYIIDEVHMLSPAAFNALLKTLEEPPSYVIFILATTEAHKIPLTIISRCQRYDFHRITQDEIVERLSDLLGREKVDFEEKALRFIARKAEGGMRDALSLTDQCISFYINRDLTYENVLKVLGAVDTERIDSLFRDIAQGDVAGVFTGLEQMIADGREITRISADLIEHMRNILLLKAGGREDILDVSESDLKLIREDAEQIGGNILMRYIRVLSDAQEAMRFAANRRVVMETALIRLCRPAMETDVDSLADRIRQLEMQIENGVMVKSISAETARAASASLTQSEAPAPKVYDKAAPPDLERIRREWTGITEDIEDMPMRIYLQQHTRQMFDPEGGHEGEIYILVDDDGAVRYIKPKESRIREELEQIIEERLGRRIAVHILGSGEAGGNMLQEIQIRQEVQQQVKAFIHAEIEEEDF